MASDIFYGLTKPELKKEIDAQVAVDNRSLPRRAKIFAAIAHLQEFDQLPEIATVEELDKHCAEGAQSATELNRGLSASSGIPGNFYARELLLGPLYPGTQSALGNGIHLADPSEKFEQAGFAKISVVAREYAQREKPGMIVRCGLKFNSNVIALDDVRQLFRENRNRARDVGLTDAGAFAAALGFDAIVCEHIYDHTEERVWIVLNRGALIFQRTGLQIA